MIQIIELGGHYTIDLPSCQTFDRPFWAYDYLPNGKRLLRQLVFGNTYSLMLAIEQFGEEILPAEILPRLLRHHPINPTLHCVMFNLSLIMPAQRFAEWYLAWEDYAFDEYCKYSRKQECTARTIMNNGN